ncbi:MAG: tRNA 5-methoxyuridine(34)/uridine 5-oxyacetic acid(34) synthase CmoB [Gammaproteobacteria bacterium]|nr:tRNA 5-methoxyuridine(34)/uridine 5-oxyacetic acid(34) synthase CmoB [Gammaproteobacteria bacterium]
MLDYPALWQCLDQLGLAAWRPALEPPLRERLQDGAHGDFGTWRHAVETLRASTGAEADLRRELLLSLSPWRKGPFDIGGVHIDSEWQSNLKWDRLKDAIAPLEGRNVLDVGSGNGYYVSRMREAGARIVLGIDPTVLYVMQYLAVQCFNTDPNAHVLPLRLEELPAGAGAFDTTFSMGVLYHQRSPIDHLRQLRATLRPGGQLVLETLFLPGEESFARTPDDRYARMRNVWLLPTIGELTTWLRRCGYRGIEIIDATLTTIDEQRATEWMPFESLAEALDADDPEHTVEGWPAPRRAIVLAISPKIS